MTGEIPFGRSYAKHSKSMGQRFTVITLTYNCRCQSVKAGFGIRPERFNSRHDYRKHGGQQGLQIFANKIIFLTRFANNRSWVNRILSMINSMNVKDREIMSKRVIAIMISKGSLLLADIRVHRSTDCKLSFSDKGVGMGRNLNSRKFFSH